MGKQRKIRKRILATLEWLDEDEFIRFKWHLQQPGNVEGLRPIPRSHLDADRMKTLAIIIQFYSSKAAHIVVNVLKKINREDLLERFLNLPNVHKQLIQGPALSSSVDGSSYIEDLRKEKELIAETLHGLEPKAPPQPADALAVSEVTNNIQVTPDASMDLTVTNTHVWRYLKLEGREPVIGLSMMTEYRSPDGLNYFNCRCCSEVIASALYLCNCHLKSASHRYKYIKMAHPHTVQYWPSSVNPNVLMYSRQLRYLAQLLEKEEGCGRLTVEAMDGVSKGNSVTATSHTDDFRKEKELVAEQETLHGLEPKAPPQPVSEVNNNIQVSPTHPSTSGGQARVTPDASMDLTVTNTDVWRYLKLEGREPVIGLSMMTEYRSPDGLNYSFCDCCLVVINTQFRCHLTSASHRYNYIKMEHPHIVHNWPSSVNPNMFIRDLRDLAQQVEKEEGCGRLKIVYEDGKTTATSDAPATNAELAIRSKTTATTSRPVDPRRAATISTATTYMTAMPPVRYMTAMQPVRYTTATIMPSLRTSSHQYRGSNYSLQAYYSKPTPAISKSIATISKPATSMIPSKPNTCPATSESQLDLWEDLDAALESGAAFEATRVSGKATATSQSSASQSPKANANSPLKADDASKTTDVSVERNGDLKMTVMCETRAESTELSKSTGAKSHLTQTSKPSTNPSVSEAPWEARREEPEPAVEATSASGGMSHTMDSLIELRNVAVATRVSGKATATSQSSTSQSPKATANSPLKAGELTELSKSTGAMSHLSPTTSVATPATSESTSTVSKCTTSTTTSKPSTTVCHSTAVMYIHTTPNISKSSKSFVTISKPSLSTSNSKPSTTVCHSTTVMSKPTATSTNTTPDISESSKSIATISKPSSSTTTSKPSTNPAGKNLSLPSKLRAFQPRVVLRRLRSQTPPATRGPSQSPTPHHQSASSTATHATAEPPGGEMTEHHPTNTEPPTTVSKLEEAKHPVMSCVLSCQVCGVIFNTTLQYFAHAKEGKHQQKMKTIFVTEADELEYEPGSFSSILMNECQYIKKKQRAEPVIGLLHIVTCVCTRASRMPRYMCLVCKCTFPASDFKAHLCDPRHIKHTLMHQNPARLPFAWKLNECDWESLAWQEENAQGPGHMVVKIIDLPSRIFCLFSDNYEHACKVLEEYFCKDWQHEVPNIITLDELQGSHTSPQLGLQFMVHYKTDRGPSGSLCLLCERMLNELEFSSHVFSFEHIKVFLQKAHPGSLDSEAKKTPVWKLLDLAKQAAEIHSTGCIQKVTYHSPIWPPYGNAVKTLKGIKKREGHGQLVPVLPVGEKLVPTETQKEIDKGTSPEMTKKPEREADNVNDRTPRPIAVPEKDSRFHIHDGKCPAQNTSDTGMSVAIETLKQSPEKKKKKAKKHVQSGSRVGQIPTNTRKWGRLPSRQGEDSILRDRRTRPGKEPVTRQKRPKRKGAGLVRTPRQGSGETSGLKRRAGHPGKGRAANKSGQRQRRAKRQREKTRRTKTRKRSIEEGDGAGDISSVNQTAEALSHVAAETNSRDQCVKHKGGATSKDAMPRVRRDRDAETQSRAARKRQRSEHTRPEAGGKRRRRRCPKATAKSPLRADGTSKTTANSKATAHIPVSTPPMFKSTTTISKPTTSMTTSKPNTTSAFSESMKSLDSALVTEAASDPTSDSGEAATTSSSQTVTEPEACDTAAPPTDQVTVTEPEACDTTAPPTDQVTVTEPEACDTAAPPTDQVASKTSTRPASTCESSPVETSESTGRSESTTNRPAVGVKFMVSVQHEERSTWFCLSCKTKLFCYRQHMSDPTHELNYVRIMCPELTSDLSETEFQKIVTDLAKRETGNVPKIVEMSYEEYEEMSTANTPTALLYPLLRQQRRSQASPSATHPQHEPSHHPDGNATHQSPDSLATDSESSPMHILPTDTQPEGPQSCDVKLESSEDPRTQPGSPQDSVKQENLQDSKEWQQTPQYSGTSQKAPLDPGIQPQDPEPMEGRSIKLEETQKSLEHPDRRPFLDPDSGHQQPVVQPLHRSHSSGERIASRVSCYLDVKLSKAERTQVVGLWSVLECQCEDLLERLVPFYLCRSCRCVVQQQHICSHIINTDHQHKYMWETHPGLMSGIRDQLDGKQKMDGFQMAVNMVAKLEQWDAEVRVLDKNSYHRVRVAPFSEGIHILEDILKQQNLTSSCPQPPDQQSSQDPPHTEELSRPPEADKSRDEEDVTDNKENVRLTKSLIETIPINLSIVKTEPVPEPLSTLNAHDSNITEMAKAVKRGLDDVTSNGDSETVKRRRISTSPDGSGTCDGRSGPYLNVSSTASPCPSLLNQVKVEPSECSTPLKQVDTVKVEPSPCPSPQHQVTRVKVKPTLVSQVLHCEPSQMQPETELELNLEASAVSTEPSTTSWFTGSSLAERESQPDLHATLSGAEQAQEPPSSEPITPISSTASQCPTPLNQVDPVKVESSQCPSPLNQVKVELNQCLSPLNQVKVETSQCPSPQHQVAILKVEPTLVSHVPHCEPSQMQRETELELNLPTNPASAVSTEPSTTPWFTGSSLAQRESPDLHATLSGAEQPQELPSSEPITTPIDMDKFRQLISLVRAKQLERAIYPASQQRSDSGINRLTLSSVSPCNPLTAAGHYGTPVDPYGQVTQNSYFTRGCSSGTGPAGIHQAPDQHSVFSENVNYTDGSTGGLNPNQTPLPQQGTGQDVIPVTELTVHQPQSNHALLYSNLL